MNNFLAKPQPTTENSFRFLHVFANSPTSVFVENIYVSVGALCRTFLPGYSMLPALRLSSGPINSSALLRTKFCGVLITLFDPKAFAAFLTGLCHFLVTVFMATWDTSSGTVADSLAAVSADIALRKFISPRSATGTHSIVLRFRSWVDAADFAKSRHVPSKKKPFASRASATRKADSIVSGNHLLAQTISIK
jgi:hypothetical protein